MIQMFSAQRANAGLDLDLAIRRVIDRHWYILGEELSQFEYDFAKAMGVRHAIGVANGTDALEIALRTLGVERGNTVATVANAGYYSSSAIHALGAIPLYVDVDPRTMTLNPRSLEVALEHKPSAVIVTHLYGQLADMSAIADICQRSKTPLIEDCAQAHGATRHNKNAGTIGAIGCFSFYPTKNLGAVGDGGALVTQEDSLAERIRTLRQYGWRAKYHVDTPGGRNSRLDELQAAVLSLKLPYLPSWNIERRRIANRYSAAFADLPLITPGLLNEDHVAHLYVVRTTERDALRSHLTAMGVGCDIHYPIPDHLQKAHANLLGQKTSLPVTEEISSQVLSLPCYPGLPDDEVDQVITAVHSFFVKGS